jgi:hypothetical protein
MSGKAPEHPDAQKQPGSDSDEDEVFFDARFPPEEEAVSKELQLYAVVIDLRGMLIIPENA